MKGGPFKLNLYPREYFDLNPYHEEEGQPPAKKEAQRTQIQPPFKPSSPGKQVRFVHQKNPLIKLLIPVPLQESVNLF